MKTGTRRMWSRRLLRAGWLIAPIFSMPKRAYKYVLCDYKDDFSWANLFLFTMVMSLAGSFGYVVYDSMTRHEPASAEAITAALQDNECMTDLMPRRAKEQGEPLTNLDLETGERDCETAYKNHYAKIEQQKTLEALGGKK